MESDGSLPHSQVPDTWTYPKWTADKEWSSSLGGLGEVLTTPHRKNVSCYEMFTQKSSDLDQFTMPVIKYIASYTIKRNKNKLKIR